MKLNEGIPVIHFGAFMSIAPLASDLLNQVSKLPSIWSGVIGGVVVFALTQSATTYREWVAESKRKRNIRKMLEIEIDHNLYVLECLKASIVADIEYLKSGHEFHTLPCTSNAKYHASIYGTLLSQLVDALLEDAVREVIQFYYTLENVNIEASALTQYDLNFATTTLECILELEEIGNPLR